MNDKPLANRRIALGITGSVAAYKACDLLRSLTRAGADVRVILTRNAARFIGEATLLSLSRNRVITDMFASAAWAGDHISLARWAELLLIAPATANIIGKAASGIADEILSTTILSVPCKVVFAPAMHSAMFQHPVVQENIARLQKNGCEFIPPETGPLASGEEGIGRLAEISTILAKVLSLLKPPG